MHSCEIDSFDIVNDKAKVSIVCPACGEKHEFTVGFISKELFAQDAFPDIPADERKMFISGLCPKCYDKLTNNIDI